jgi:hypothetical protein
MTERSRVPKARPPRRRCHDCRGTVRIGETGLYATYAVPAGRPVRKAFCWGCWLKRTDE